MLACTIISKYLRLFSSLIFFILLGLSAPAFAQAPGPQDQNGAPTPAIPAQKKEDSGLFDQTSPYLDYGDFSLNEEENEDTQYFQYGRFFGLSFGGGYETATGNRGKLYEPALPRFDIRVHYWFSFQFAADLGLFVANHSFLDGTLNHDVKLIGYGVHLKYYFDVRDAAAPLTFANPYLSVGAGAINKTQTTSTQATPDIDSTISASIGGGLEFPIKYKKTYLELELLYNTQSFADTNETIYKAVPDLTGGFMSLLAHFMFVW